MTHFLSLLRLFSYVRQMPLLFVCNGPAVPPAIYSEPRFHESFVVCSQQAILETSVGRNSRF